MSEQDLYAELEERGFIRQCTDAAALRAQLQAGPMTVYTGYDPTADSLHVGHLVTLMALKHFERAGHRPLVLLGGGTAMIGDPSGKTEQRSLIEASQIDANARALSAQVGRLLDVAGGQSRVVNNADWLKGLQLIPFLRDIGRHFSVNRMLSVEAYRARFERGLSFIEFNYQLLQAYDFYHLCGTVDCRLQLGGDDQWGNILAGVDLCRRMLQVPVQGLTYPLLTTASGAKMGKTAAGAVWLDPARLPPYDYFQYWVNTDDADLARFLALFTFLPMAEIRATAALQGAERNAAKRVLAYEATAIVHGASAASAALQAAQAAFGGAAACPAEILSSSSLPRAGAADAAQLPTTALTAGELGAGMPLAQLLVHLDLAASKAAARRLIQQGAVRCDDVRLNDEAWQLTPAQLQAGPVLIKVGKKHLHRVLWLDG